MENKKKEFEIVFKEFEGVIRNISYSYSTRYKIPRDELISSLNLELWEAYKKYNKEAGTTFNTFANMLLNRKAIDIVRGKHGGYARRVLTELIIKDDDGEEQSILDQLEDITSSFEEEIIKKEDQRQLILYLVGQDKTDPVTTAIVTNFGKHDSIRALGKALGIHHETVKRKLRKLSSYYDANRFGDINDYLAV